MDNHDEMNSFQTLRGSVEGQEQEEEIYFHFCAALRIYGRIGRLERIDKLLGVAPTSFHRKGEQKGSLSMVYEDDLWMYQANVAEDEPLDRHLIALWEVLRPRKAELLTLKQQLNVDVFCGYRTNCDHAGIEVAPECLEMFAELSIPFGLSIVVI